MKLTLAVLSILSAGALPAAYNYQVLSGASEGALVSRTIGATEYTYVAYRDSSNSLAVARLSKGVLVPETVWANMPPSNTSINVSTTGSVLVSFWSGNKYRFAMKVAPGNGNCGSSSNWQCGDVPLPPHTTGTALGRIHGDVDSTSRAHFIYAFRSTTLNSSLDALYYRARHFLTGVWSDSSAIDVFFGTSDASLVPTSLYVGTAAYPSSLQYITFGNGYLFLGSGSNLPDAPAWLTQLFPTSDVMYGSADTTRAHSAVCTIKNASPAIARVTRRSTTTGSWIGITTVYDASQPSPPTARCSISERASGGGTVAVTSTQGIVYVANTAAVNWTGWALSSVDSSNTFSKASVSHDKNGKILVLYHAPGFLKLAREQ